MLEKQPVHRRRHGVVLRQPVGRLRTTCSARPAWTTRHGRTRAYLSFLAGGLADAARLERYAAEAPRIVEYFDRLGVALQEVAGLPDHYYPIAPGARPHGRTLEVQPFPRADLGDWADRLEDTPYMPRGVTWSEVLGWGGFGNQHQWDPAQLAARRDRFSAGQGLAAALLRVALAHGVEVRTDAPVTRLVVEGGRVAGVAVARRRRGAGPARAARRAAGLRRLRGQPDADGGAGRLWRCAQPLPARRDR